MIESIRNANKACSCILRSMEFVQLSCLLGNPYRIKLQQSKRLVTKAFTKISVHSPNVKLEPLRGTYRGPVGHGIA